MFFVPLRNGTKAATTNVGLYGTSLTCEKKHRATSDSGLPLTSHTRPKARAMLSMPGCYEYGRVVIWWCYSTEMF